MSKPELTDAEVREEVASIDTKLEMPCQVAFATENKIGINTFTTIARLSRRCRELLRDNKTHTDYGLEQDATITAQGKVIDECKIFLDVVAFASKGSRYQVGLKSEGRKQLSFLLQSIADLRKE